MTFSQVAGGWATSPKCVLVLILVCLLSLAFSQPYNEPKCDEMCEKLRPKGRRAPFKFQCTDSKLLKTEFEQRACNETCKYCKKENCDETIDPSKWHCKEIPVNPACMDYCDKHRAQGDINEYTLKCEDVAGSGQQECRDICGNCPDVICNKYKDDKYVFYCPEYRFKGPCKDQCESLRRFGQVDKFEFECGSEFAGDSTKITRCEDACNDCPDFICKPTSPFHFHCPVAQLDKACLDECEKGRQPGVDSSFEWNCKRTYEKEGDDNWKSHCNTACTSHCANNPYVCQATDPKIFKCPRKQIEDEEPKGERSYKGTCREKCNDNQAGGINPYELHCNQRYKTKEEQEQCITDCKACYSDNYCDVEKKPIECKGNEAELERLKQIAKKEKAIHEAKLEAIRQTGTEEIIKWLIAGGVVAGLLLVGCVGYCIYAKRRNRKEFPQQYAVAVMIPMQQQQAIARNQQSPHYTFSMTTSQAQIKPEQEPLSAPPPIS